jgi:hypothetical protein
MKRERSPLERQAADLLRRARKLPMGPDRNDLRQLALGLRWLHRKGVDASFGTFGSMSDKEQPAGALQDGADESKTAGQGREVPLDAGSVG